MATIIKRNMSLRAVGEATLALSGTVRQGKCASGANVSSLNRRLPRRLAARNDIQKLFMARPSAGWVLLATYRLECA